MAKYIECELAIAETRKPRLTDAELRRRLASIPAADVAPVVRCGECNHWHRCLSDDGKTEFFNFSHCQKGHHGFPNFFCADGERKDGDGDV